MFKFDLGQEVKIVESKEKGVVIARSDNIDTKNQYNIRYEAADGRLVENWWFESVLCSIE